MIERFIPDHPISVQSICDLHDIDFHDFSKWALGDADASPDLKDVPDLWNKLHPDDKIYSNGLVYLDLLMMMELYLLENS